MSIADRFEPRRDAGFVRSYDFEAARRQLQVSLILIAVMAGAALALGLVARFGPLDPQSSPAARHGRGAAIAETLLDNRS